MHKILLTCPPMIGMVDEFAQDFAAAYFDVTIPELSQEMTEDALCEIIGDFDGWIIGDDPATRKVIEAGVNGRLKACMRWGVGTNNVDFNAFKKHNVPIENTPGVFGREVADLACHYVTALARKTYDIDRNVKKGKWHKPIGRSLWATRALIVGMGDIGKNLAKRLYAHDIDVHFHDPFVSQEQAGSACLKASWPEALGSVDFVIFTAPLTDDTYHMFNDDALSCLKLGAKIINVGRGPLIDEQALIKGLSQNIIESAALDVFETEPFSTIYHSELLHFEDRLILGSHNGSNTQEAVANVSRLCINKLAGMLNKARSQKAL